MADYEDIADHISNTLAEYLSTNKSDAITVAKGLVEVLEHTLSGIRQYGDPGERFDNAREISRLLEHLLIVHGRVPS